jgi:hypothetical protein
MRVLGLGHVLGIVPTGANQMRPVWASTCIHGIPEPVSGWRVGVFKFQVAPSLCEITIAGGPPPVGNVKIPLPLLCGAKTTVPF